MKIYRLLFLLFFISVIGCKKEVNKNEVSTKENNSTQKEESFNKINLQHHSIWSLDRVKLEAVNENLNYNGDDVFLISRISSTETAYATLSDIAVTFGNEYLVSVIVKKATIGDLFGLRIVGEYPNRIDVVFDLKNGEVKGSMEEVGDFIKESAHIEDLSNGWYKCSFKGIVYSDTIKIILGPTSGLGKTITWEAPTTDLCNTYIIPSSLKLEEISYTK
ncbi:hypothetical protein [Mangrovimonas sp. YM274]|uniref:phage head spike fiber domain-containing protein n=1 Tax=Mangrovimonas sp. YM274 TaxID=3070660 RepID=UPI0027DC2C18|nr:hypothetical protein [Mangrovimonas sp. YM274]WMI68930.1 hypothetical protein RBH95_00840 [Mangrovimonas sp. YM274]